MSKFLDFLGDLKAYVPSGSDALQILIGSLAGGITATPNSGASLLTDEVDPAAIGPSFSNNSLLNRIAKPESYYTDKGVEFYPSDLFQAGNEAYILFFMRDSVYSSAALLKRIALYMPASVAVNYGAEWQPINMFITQDQRSALKSEVGGMIDSTSTEEALNRLTSLLAGTGAEGFMTAVTKSVSQSIMNETSIGQQASVIAGKTVNPMTSLAFRNVNLRQFKFRFELMARSAEESESIKNIISILKYGMHPASVKNVTIGGASDTTVNNLAEKTFLNYPNTFDIFLFSPSAEYLFQIQRSVLYDMIVNYNGHEGAVASFFKKTGAPTNITLELAFQETEILTRDRVMMGY
jgi:hypothetical protein